MRERGSWSPAEIWRGVSGSAYNNIEGGAGILYFIAADC